VEDFDMAHDLRAARLLARASFGARPGELAQTRSGNTEAWLARQWTPTRDAALDRRLAGFQLLDLEPGEMQAGMMLPDSRERGKVSKEVKKELARQSRAVTAEVVGARIVRAVHGRQSLREVMIDFWGNHFSVFARKGPVASVLPHYQREVIERHALGRFGDLLLASARSPAMLFYLDNWISTAPQRARRRSARRPNRGINENYARELLELHTLGIAGGYSQQDVREVARVFTGWSLEGRKRPVFRFNERHHDPGHKVVLDERVRGHGIEEGEWLLERLARHPSTACFISHKLASRFIADDPPPALVERAARRFLETEGDIPAVLEVLLLSQEFIDPELRKLKTPFRFAASALRATGGETNGTPPVVRAFGRLGELPYASRTPQGFPEASENWIDPAAMLERMGLAFALASGRVRGARLGSGWPDATPARIPGLRDSESLAVALASPEFQWA
jgi:uncharacterized protein (DUF1800 family)